FLFDEPLSNLDAALRVQMRMEIAALATSLPQTTMIYVTHDQVEAMTMADRIVVLREGMVEQVGTPMELYDTPNSLFVAGFIGSPRMNFFTGELARKLNVHTVGVRAEHLEFVRNGDWSGKVVHTENLGSDSFVYVEIGADTPVVVRLPGKSELQPDDEVSLSPLVGKVHRFDENGKPVTMEQAPAQAK
ncbi:MAG: ABC transporter ATP-binding protein, partial [Halocynthiibacter sp.]